MMHIHLDPVGGIAGDMFAAAILDAFPHLQPPLLQALASLNLPGLRYEWTPISENALTGGRVCVTMDQDYAGHDHAHDHHSHRSFRQICIYLESSSLPPDVVSRTLGIFRLLAEAEASVHGTTPEDVEFHEVGAWDSIADIVAAAFLIGALNDPTWSVSPVPLGGGRVTTAHGVLPVPAPATVLLLKGMIVDDDGIPGERVTPTGAAILRFLRPAPRPPAGRLTRSGSGFGSRQLPGLPNVLRCLALEADASASDTDIAVIEFDVDDQPAEDLAVGLDNLRATPGVIDVYQTPVIGKKGRMVAHVSVLAQPSAIQPVADACFMETTSLGIRWTMAERKVLPRTLWRMPMDDSSGLTVKVADRPTAGATAKTDISGVAGIAGASARARLRAQAEEAFLAPWKGTNPK